MIVGFTITDFRGRENEAAEFIRRVCILEDSSIAQNIVSTGIGVNIFSKGLTISDLQSQPFECTPIETRDGEFLVISAVDFNVELLYNDNILRLSPTEFIYVKDGEVEQFRKYIKQGLIVTIPEVTNKDDLWILNEGFWNDEGVWVDSDFWRDL